MSTVQDVAPPQPGAHINTRRQTHREKVLAHAAARLAPAGAAAPAREVAEQLRTFLKLETERLRMAHYTGASGRQSAVARSFVLDLAVEHAFREAVRLSEAEGVLVQPQSGFALVAVGGYGRAELAPYSDLDILFLYSNHRAAQLRQVAEHVLRLLWDAGLTVGHSLRTVGDAVTAARTDPHLQTALVHRRLVAGNRGIFNSLAEALEKDRRKRADAFLAAVGHERDSRHLKFGETVCLQEPNVKESAGGLRDYHTALWAAHARFGSTTVEELRARGIISEDEAQRSARAYDFLWRIRYAAHFHARRKTERLALDVQPVLAQELGYKPGAYLLGSEKFMRDYYRQARELYLFSEAVLARTADAESKGGRWWGRRATVKGNEPFSISEGRLQFDGDAEFFLKKPLALFDAFALAQAARVPFGHGLDSVVRRSLQAVRPAFRASADTSGAFMRLLRRRGRAGFVLRLMHEAGFLSRLVPEFGRVSLLVQHDLYHQYTVDEHTLRAVEALDELHTGQDKPRAQLRAVFDEVADPALLYLSLLLHDIGKGRGRGHIARGVKIAERIARRLQLTKGETEKVLLLVRLHVAMSHVAQRRDLNEPQVIKEFAARVNDLDSLNMLLLLTYADLNAVAPGVWSEWKGTLLWDLYRRARTLMTGDDAPVDEAAKRAHFKEQVALALDHAIPQSEVERHIALLPDRYLRVTEPATAAVHLRLVEEIESAPLAWRWVRHGTTSTELTICTRDRHGLFADMAGTLAAHGIEILSAELNTREDAVALDVFMLREASTHHAIDAHRYAAIERALQKSIAGEADVAALVERWRTRNAPRRRAVPAASRRRDLPRVVCDNEASPSSTLVEVHAYDEPGLAHKIASALALVGLDIVCARIATEKADALDVFYVTDRTGLKLSGEAMREVETVLKERLSRPGDAVPGG
ncbi:MAG TPA: [protein-PII] uridylyltransferase [Pyrinomonadaceae bacterium]|nr:[protein-PII] uridylyltransferase [Pyrinomonadaceae bacterium]